jgi:NAD-dependent deacetylase
VSESSAALAAATAELADGLAALGHAPLLVVTGAGISAASGIPTFRGNDPGAIWRHDVTTLATRAYFEDDPVGSWRWYLARFAKLGEARPNAAHRALVDLERWQRARGDFLLVTQNIDTLHEDAGSERLVKVHGSSDRVRCSRPGCRLAAPGGSLPRAGLDLEAFVTEPSRETLPLCPRCGAILRQHVLWFDESYNKHDDYQWDRVVDAAGAAGGVLFVGTSFAVGVTALVLDHALMLGAPVWSIDPARRAPPHRRVRVLPVPAEELLPAVVAALGTNNAGRV